MPDPITVYVSNLDPAFHDQVRAVSDRIRLLTPEMLKAEPERVGEVEVLYGGLGRQELAMAERLRWIQTGGAGVNGLMIPEVLERSVTITNARIHADAITEHVFGMLLAMTRRLREAWDQQKTRTWRGYPFTERMETLAGKTLAILGVGTIGAQTARVGKALGLRVIGMRRSGEPHPDVERMFTPDQLGELLAEADIVVDILPLTEKTRHFLGAAEFAAMKPGAWVVNVGRGGTIDTEALMEALRQGKLAAALLDVTDPEPLPEEHPLWGMENVFITPHYGGAQPGYQRRAGAVFLENLRRYVAGEPLLNIVDPREGY
jgi:D-2-hydroxyacid dehydrogenase (NADP+)